MPRTKRSSRPARSRQPQPIARRSGPINTKLLYLLVIFLLVGCMLFALVPAGIPIKP